VRALEKIELAVQELCDPMRWRDREANRPPALLYSHLMDCISREPHGNFDTLGIPWGEAPEQVPQKQNDEEDTEERMYA
jgi:hypothetical protein